MAPEPARITVWPGTAYPLGATFDGAGTNFSLFSEVADRVELCLIDDNDHETRIELDEVDGFVWHAYLPTITPGRQPLKSATYLTELSMRTPVAVTCQAVAPRLPMESASYWPAVLKTKFS